MNPTSAENHQHADWRRHAAQVVPRTLAHIGGRGVPARSGRTFTAINPATEAVIAEVASCDAPDVDDAVRAARHAFESGVWSRCAPAERKRVADAFSVGKAGGLHRSGSGGGSGVRRRSWITNGNREVASRQRRVSVSVSAVHAR